MQSDEPGPRYTATANEGVNAEINVEINVEALDGVFWPRLMHRWFVEYNPLYLLSATLVLGGIWLLSQEAAREGSVIGQLGLAALAEVYAFALIGGAALLWRIALRRPAVLLALLAVLYQGDLTLHVETCAYLGAVGRWASVLWVALFAVKLVALGWALELRPSRSALVVPMLGAAGLALLPHVFREVGPDGRASALALVAFSVGAAALWTHRHVESAVGFDVRGRRALRGTWLLWAILALAHVGYMATEHQLDLWVLLPVATLLCGRVMENELKVWVLVVFTLVGVTLAFPAAVSSFALAGGVVLALRALRTPVGPVAPVARPVEPYRGALPAPPTLEVARFGLAPRLARERLLLGAAVCGYLALWTLFWSGGSWPAHHLALDLALFVVFVGAAVRARRWLRLTPVGLNFAHLAAQIGWLGAPEGALEWGLASVSLGFACLLVSLVVSWRLRPSSCPYPT